MNFQKIKILVHLTDTCYWFATPFDDEKWIQKIFEIKKRPKWKIFSLLFSDLKQLKEYCFIDKKQEKFILENKFFSSFILKKKEKLKNFSPEFDTICARIENEKFDFCPIKNDFFKNWKKPVTTTSVNISWDKNFYWKEKILKKFWNFLEIEKKFPRNFQEKEKFLCSSKIFNLTKFDWEKFFRIR